MSAERVMEEGGAAAHAHAQRGPTATLLSLCKEQPWSLEMQILQ